MFDRCFLKFHILVPLLEQHSIRTQPNYIPVKNGPVFRKHKNCKIDILQIMEIGLVKIGESVAVNRPRIQIIVVGGDCPIPPQLPSTGLSPFEQKKVVSSFDLHCSRRFPSKHRCCHVFA
jgi:hypothetical protein